MPSEPWVLSLDVGTSSVRAIGYTAAGEPIPGVEYALCHTPETTADGGSELAASPLLTRCIEVLRQALDRRGALPPPTAVAVSTFWHSLLGLNATNEAVTPVYLWADTRSAAQVNRLRSLLDERRVHERTGCVFHTSYLPARLLWLRAMQPDLFADIRYWVSFADYFYLRLFNELATSYGMASGSGLFDQNRLCWDAEVCAAAGIAVSQLPTLVGAGHALRGLTSPWRSVLPELADVPWFPAAGDGACSNVGSGCAQPDRLALMVGTSGAMRCVLERDSITAPPGLWCYRLDERRFVVGGALSNGGNLFAWLTHSLQLPPPAELEAALATQAPDSHGLTVLPFLAGERSPGWVAEATGAFLGLRQHTTPVQLVRAALEAVALRFALIYERLRAEVPAARLVVATGGALLRSPAWLQIMADALGTPVQASTVAEASCRGAALLALEQLHLVPDLAHLPAGTGTAYTPVAAHTEIYRAARSRQEKAYRLWVQQQNAWS